MASEQELTAADYADILTSALELLADGGIQIGAKDAPAKNGRPAGVLIFCGGFAVQDGNIVPQKENQ